MNPTGVLALASMLATVAGRSLVIAAAAAAPQSDAGAAVPTAKEQALMEHACRLVQTGLAHDAYQRCLEARLLSLRADFGPDLTQLSAASRAKIDAACSPAQASLGHDGYLGCLTEQLASLAARARATVPAGGGAAPPATDVTPVVDDSPVVAEPEPTLLSVRTAAVAAAGVVAAAALVFFGVRARQRKRVLCRVCGVGVDGAADLCSACRRDAAEAVRQAANDRAGQRRAVEAEERRQQEEAEQQQVEGVRREQQEQQRRLDEERRAVEEAAAREAIARRDAEERRRVEAEPSCDADESAFDPYAALGLPQGAGDAEIRAAYEEARLKYDPAEVAHLGYDAKQHFARRWRAIERAYQLLAGSPASR